jgi:hypothetical protein
MPISAYDNAGALWMLGVAGGDRWPAALSNGYLAGVGTDATGDATLSWLNGAKAVQIIGVQVTTAAASTFDIIQHNGAAVVVLSAGLSRSTATVGWFPFGADGVRFESAAGLANIGLRCGGASVATLFYRKLA